MTNIKKIISYQPPPPTSTPFKFEMTAEAANHNATILESHNYDLTRTIAAYPNSHISYGSEFRTSTVLHPLLSKSPLWPAISSILNKGAKYPLDRLSNKRRKADLEEALTRGNHKSAKSEPKILTKLIQKDVTAGYQLPTTIASLRKIPHTCIAPYGVVHQTTIDDQGNLIPKKRAAHDQSFKFSSGSSVNSRVQTEKLTKLIYGDALRRILHYIHSLRFHHPGVPILIGKFDFSAAYKRMTLWGHSSAASSTCHDDIAYIGLRLMFGGAPCPPLWCSMSETITDLANDILACPEWDLASTHSPHKSKIKQPRILPDNIPFATALQADVDVDPLIHGKVDCYIDDLIPVVLHIDNNAEKGANAVPLAMHTVGRPVHKDEPITRDDMLCFRKLYGEGQLDEIKIVTGWGIDSRRFLVFLTDDKEAAWSSSISNIIEKGFSNFNEIESLVGRLNHCGYIIPLARHFLHPIRNLLYRSPKRHIILHQHEVTYLKLWQRFLTYAKAGISINNVVYRRPTHIRWDDSCPVGIGGISISGKAYRYHLPRHLQGRVSNNALEFLASVVGCWVNILEGTIKPKSCILALTDNSSACGWLHKTNFIRKCHVFHATVAEKLATLFINADSTIYSQHFAGSLNVIADSLSRDFHIPDSELISLLKSTFPQQTPNNFKISPLPHKITSWINCLLLAMPEKAPEHQPQMPSSTGRGYAGSNSSTASKYNTTNSSTALKHKTASDYLAHSPKPSEKENFHETVKSTWRAARAERPWTKWQRSIGQTVGLTPAMVYPTTSTITSAYNTEVTPTTTHQPNNKRPSRHLSTGITTTDQPPTTKKR